MEQHIRVLLDDDKGGRRAAISLVLLAALGLVFLLRRRGGDRLSSFPGPRLAAWTRLHSVAAVLTGREHEMMLEAHRRYGPVVRWSPNTLLISDPMALPKMYHLRANKTPHYNHSPGEFRGMVEENDWRKHRQKRHRMDPPFSSKSVQDDEPLMDAFIAEWIDALTTKFTMPNSQVFDFSDWGNYLVLDIVTKRFFGREMGFIKHGDKTRMLADSRANGPAIHALARLPQLKQFLLHKFGRFLIPTAGDGSGLGNVLALRDEFLQERLAKDEKNPDVGLDQVLFDSANAGMELEELKEDILFVILGASDTTGHGIRCLVRNLLQNPSCLVRLRKEMDAAVMPPVGTTDRPSSITFAQIKSQIPYLSACIRETLRRDPPIVSYLPRWADDDHNGTGGVELCGRFVPAGVEVACSPYVLSRSRDMFGDDADDFRPERYLESSTPEWVAKAARYDFTFGYGPRQCIGQTLSHFITCKTIVQLFYHFDIELLEPGSGKAFLNWNYSGLKIRLTRRI
ncbi:cytochrome P450 [Chaetomidium leptoderma]|uniref:Cytochrome P450 n=1 Tax=Chaetomidium leptoderma TaxID=669021 RepID=A0AAN6ZV75_9PEZI|nr:cytochrome P450 [Chaetomidium leptoderma]